MAPEVAAQIVRDELMLDGNARLNLATFVTTWAEPQAELLMGLCQDKNMIDKDEYPNTAELEVRCVNMLSRLWHSPDADQTTGCSLRVVVKRGFTHDMADLLVHDLKRQLPRLEKQPVPVHDAASGSGFHH
jgi:Pyridoxal-dependent decarboxylase conserved domain